MTEQEAQDLSAIRERLKHLSTTVEHMAGDLRALRDSEKIRQGREQAAERRASERHDERAGVWVRALLPTGVLSAVWFAVWNWLIGMEP